MCQRTPSGCGVATGGAATGFGAIAGGSATGMLGVAAGARGGITGGIVAPMSVIGGGARVASAGFSGVWGNSTRSSGGGMLTPPLAGSSPIAGGGNGNPGTDGGVVIGGIPIPTGIDGGNGAGAVGAGCGAGIGASFTGSNFDLVTGETGVSDRGLGGVGGTAVGLVGARFGEVARYAGGSTPGGGRSGFITGTGNDPGVAPVMEYQLAEARGYWPVGA